MKATVAKISETGKSACVMVSESAFSMNRVPVYIPNNGYAAKQELDLPDGLKIIDWDGHATKDGIPLKTFA